MMKLIASTFHGKMFLFLVLEFFLNCGYLMWMEFFELEIMWGPYFKNPWEAHWSCFSSLETNALSLIGGCSEGSFPVLLGGKWSYHLPVFKHLSPSLSIHTTPEILPWWISIVLPLSLGKSCLLIWDFIPQIT